MILPTLRHLLLPHHSNNHRPKLLHHKSLLVLVLLIFIFSLTTFSLRKTVPGILGVATNITTSDLLTFTNQKRAEQGLSPLTLNNQLSAAAGAKAADMFSKNYWAHNSPDGTTPWVFFQNVGYNYLYAGENLAKDFNDSDAVVAAWMTSPSHRENMLSGKYEEVGFAVVNGTLNGQETTLVVEHFGKHYAPEAVAAVPSEAVQIVSVQEAVPTIVPTATPLPPTPMPSPTPVLEEAPTPQETLIAGITNKPLIDSAFLTKRVAIIILAILILAFVLDMIYIERRKLVRLVGHNMDHILFLAGAIVLTLVFGRGVIL